MEKYVPINCNYYDELEALATRRQSVPIAYKNENGDRLEVESVIVDFFIKDKVEFLQLRSGLNIRLDYLISVNGLLLPTDGTCQI